MITTRYGRMFRCDHDGYPTVIASTRTEARCRMDILVHRQTMPDDIEIANKLYDLLSEAIKKANEKCCDHSKLNT